MLMAQPFTTLQPMVPLFKLKIRHWLAKNWLHPELVTSVSPVA
jgi:hypothetical protein